VGSRFDICGKCGEHLSFREPDPCLGTLPGVAHACCGHQNEQMAYCCGWPGCKPNESVKLIGFDEEGKEMSEHKGFWIKRGKEALQWMRDNSSSQ